MFLYDNNIISENSLRINTEPDIDFYTEAVSYNKALLASSMQATKEMLDTIMEYGDSPKIVQESFSDFKDKIVKFLREFKAKIVTLFRRWIDWIAKKLHMKGRYTDEAMEALLKDSNKVNRLSGFRLQLNEEVDFGHKYFNELTTSAYPSNLYTMAIKISTARVNTPASDHNTYDLKQLKDSLVAETTAILNGSKTRELTLNDIKVIFDYKKDGEKTLNKYKEGVMKTIDQINNLTTHIGKGGNDALKDQQACNSIITLASCLGDHLSTMANAYPTYIDRINSAIVRFLPAAEEYMIAQG